MHAGERVDRRDDDPLLHALEVEADECVAHQDVTDSRGLDADRQQRCSMSRSVIAAPMDTSTSPCARYRATGALATSDYGYSHLRTRRRRAT